MSALATYHVQFDADHKVTLLAKDKATATRMACQHFAKSLGVPGWTRIPQRIVVVV